jgi:hypothetical protein
MTNPLSKHGKKTDKPSVPSFNDMKGKGASDESVTVPEAVKEEKPKQQQKKQTQKQVTPELNTDMIDYAEPEKIPTKQQSIYLDIDVVEALDKWAGTQRMKKGAKSGLINSLLMKAFNIRQD